MSVQTPPDAPHVPAEVSVPRLDETWGDIRRLMEQHATLVYCEVQADARRFAVGLTELFTGIVVAVSGMLLLGFMIAHWIHWSDSVLQPSGIPLWQGFAIVGGAFFALGGVLVGLGYMTLRSFNPLPDRSLRILWNNLGELSNSVK